MKPNTKKPKSPPPPQVKKGREKDIKKLKNVEKMEEQRTSYEMDDCVVCLNEKEMTEKNTIRCGETTHVLCEDCKAQLKKNECPLCRSHPVNDINTVNVNNTFNVDYIILNSLRNHDIRNMRILNPSRYLKYDGIYLNGNELISVEFKNYTLR